MATLVIQGREVEVDDSFRNLSPEQQNSAVEEIARSFSAPSRGGVEMAAPSIGVGNIPMASAQGALSSIAGVLGAPVDLANLAVGAKQPFLGSESIRGGLNRAMQTVGGMIGGTPGYNYVPSSVSDVAPELRPAFRSGEAIGGAVPFLGALGLAARGAPIAATVARGAAAPATESLGSAAAQAVRKMVADAASSPNFVRQQIPGALGAGVGAAGAEIAFPGSEIAQIGGQLAGGLAGIAASSGAGAAGQGYTSLRQKFTPQSEDAARSASAQKLAQMFSEAGESPAAIAARLAAPDVVPGGLAGDRAQSRVLSGVQSFFEEQNPAVANALAASRERVAQGIRSGVEEGFAPGQTSALTEAAARTKKSFETNLNKLATDAETRAQEKIASASQLGEGQIAAARGRAQELAGTAAEAAAPVSPLSSSRAQALNIEARNILEDALSKARATERNLWGRVPQNAPVTPSSTLNSYRSITSEMLPEDSLPGLVDRVMKRFDATVKAEAEGADFTPITFKDLQNLRSDLLEEARGLRSQGQFRDARRVGNIADGVLDDMSQVGGDAAVTAREFSRSLNDRFSRSFAGDVLGTKDTGAPRVRPELTLEAATGGAPERSAAQLRELQTAVGEQAPAMQATQQEFLRTLSESVVDPVSGAVDPRKASLFLRNNAAILDQFPEYRDALRSAASAQGAAAEAAAGVPVAERAAATALRQTEKEAQSALNDVLKRTGDAAKRSEKLSAFGRVLAAGEDPARAVTAAINSNTPVRDMNKLAALALKGGPDAVGGLRAAILSSVTDQSNVGSKFSYGRFSELLNNPLSPNGPTLLKSMENNRLISRDQASQIETIVKRGVQSEIERITGIKVNEFGSQSGIYVRYAARFLGTKIGSMLPVSGAGQSLQVANMSANLGERMASRLPADKMNEVMAKALTSEDPTMLLDILDRAISIPTAGGKIVSRDPEASRMIATIRALLPQLEGEREERRPGTFAPEELGRR
jgi:hypothetical protein